MDQEIGSIGCRILECLGTVKAPLAVILVHEKRTNELS